MDVLISKEQAIDKIKKRLFETAFNNVGIKQNVDETLVDVAENRLENWLDELPSIQPEQRWIPVAEALPEEYCECLVTYKSDGDKMLMDIVEYEPSFEFDHEKNRFKGNWLFADDCRSVNPEVIAWKPLPEPYQGGD